MTRERGLTRRDAALGSLAALLGGAAGTGACARRGSAYGSISGGFVDQGMALGHALRDGTWLGGLAHGDERERDPAAPEASPASHGRVPSTALLGSVGEHFRERPTRTGCGGLRGLLRCVPRTPLGPVRRRGGGG